MTEKTYRIGEVSAFLDLKSYVLRFWETEFSQLAPLRTNKGQRLYTEADVALLSRIKHLLHEQGMTIDGARRVLQMPAESDNISQVTASNASAQSVASGARDVSVVKDSVFEELHRELVVIRALLKPRP